MPKLSKSFFRLFHFLALSGILFSIAACRQPAFDSRSVRLTFSGLRPVQPRLSGLAFGPCKSSGEFIPVASCQSLGEDQSEKLRDLNRGRRRALAAAPDPDQLQAAALLLMATKSRDPGELMAAAGDLHEAANLESDPRRRASIFSDLAAANLMLAEIQQSPLEIAVALEHSLAALELAPDLEEARFNSYLALVLLGVDPLEAVSSDRWKMELSSRIHFGPEGQKAGTPNPCQSESQVRGTIDSWSDHNPMAPWPAPGGECLSRGEDKFFADFRLATVENPARAAESWRLFRAAEKTCYASAKGPSAEELERLEKFAPPAPILLEARYLAATLAYQGDRFDESLAILRDLVSAAKNHSYFALAAKATRFIALIHQIRGNYGAALPLLEDALASARRAGSLEAEGGVLSLLIEQQELVGRDDEAWTTLTRSLRVLHPKNQVVLRVHCLQSAARLALRRNLSQVATLLQDRAVALAAEAPPNLAPMVLLYAYKERGEVLARLGRKERAREDWREARRILDGGLLQPTMAMKAASDLGLLESRVAESFPGRRATLEATLAQYRRDQYERGYLPVQLALAQALRAEGTDAEAIATLQQALQDLAMRTGRVSWVEANALVEEARPLAETLVGLLLDAGEDREALQAIGQFLSLRQGPLAANPMAAEGQRLTYFVREREVVILLENLGQLEVVRVPAERSQLQNLRETLLLQLRSRRADPARVSSATRKLAALLIEPIAGKLAAGSRLRIVPDDVLMGVPFILLPVGKTGDRLLIDDFIVGYAADLRETPEPAKGESAILVGSASKEAGMDDLQHVGEEISGVAAAYASPLRLEGPEATAARLRAALTAPARIGHFAGHFVANPRFPLQSYFVLGNEAQGSGRLTLEDLLIGSKTPFSLLYLSGCETGRGLPASANGLHSLAQAISSAGVATAVLSLWPLDDEVGAAIAARFHLEYGGGTSAEEALRAAQLQFRNLPPGKWAPLAVFH